MSGADHWRETTLGAAAQVDRAVVSPERIKSGTRYVGLEHLDSDGALTDATVDAGDLRSAKFSFTERHVLYGKLRPYLRKIARPQFRGVCSTDILPILPGPDLDRDFLFHYLRQPLIVSLAAARSDGVNLPRLSPKTLTEFPLRLPPLGEQRQIAAVLDKADGIGRKRRESLRLLDEFLRSAFLEMFGDPVRNEKGWEVLTLERIADVQGGLQVTARRANNAKDVPYLRVANVYRDRLELSEIKTLRVTEDELERAKLQAGDVLVVEGHGNPEEIGRSAVWDGSIEQCVHQNHLIRVRADKTMAEPDYVSAFLNSAGGRRQMFRSGKTTSGLNTISTGNVRRVQVMLPPIDLQRLYSRLRREVVASGQRMRTAAGEIDGLFDSLAHLAFRGAL